MALLEDVLLVGTRASQPVATAVSPGTLYAVNDEGYKIEQSDGATWNQYGPAGSGSSLPATVQGDTLYASAANTVIALAKNASATRYLSNTGASNNPAWAQVALATGVSGTLPVANGGTGVASAFSPMLLASVNLTNAQTLALPTTPITIVAAPGSGFRIKLIAGTFQSDFSSGAYTNINATFSVLSFVSATSLAYVSTPVVNDSAATLTNLSGFLGATVVAIQDVIAYQVSPGGWVMPDAAAGSATSNYDNRAVQVAVDNNGSGNLTGGNAANVLKCKVWYVVEAL